MKILSETIIDHNDYGMGPSGAGRKAHDSKHHFLYNTEKLKNQIN
jgi:hypothetical protein